MNTTTTVENFHIDADFAESMNCLSPEESSQLEGNLLHEGCRDALIAWQEEKLLLDGHDRFELCQKHGLPYSTHCISFPDRQAALEWICKNQLGRRNLTPFQKAEVALKFKPMLAEKAKERQRAAGKEHGEKHPKEEVVENSPQPLTSRVREELASKAGVSSNTLGCAEYISKHADDKTKQRLRSSDTTINVEYKRLRKERQRAAGKEYGENHPKEEVVAPGPQPLEQKKVRNELAAKANVGSRTITLDIESVPFSQTRAFSPTSFRV